MGALCCCLEVEDIDEYVNPNNSTSRTSCISLQCFLNIYARLFQRGRINALPSSIESTTTSNSPSSHDNSLSDFYRSPPRPLPYDADPRSYHSRRDRFFSRRKKGSSHSEESEPLRRRLPDTDLGYVHKGEKWIDSDEDRPNEGLPKSTVKHQLAVSSRADYSYSSSEDEDVCPTCLEEYTPDNPRIVTECSHHYHLGCIYEWMERSENCPVCGKVMAFNETS